ncbi:MAG: DUF3604 domain-containing protein [Armatimonadota bacterium]
MNRISYREQAFSIDSPVLVKDSSGNIWIINAFHGDDPDYRNGYVTTFTLSDIDNRMTLIAEPGVYSSVSAAVDSSGTIWTAFTHTLDGNARICLTGFRDNDVLDTIDVTDGFGKYERPKVVVQGDSLWVTWQGYEQSGCAIYAKRFDINGTSIEASDTRRVTPIGGRCYQAYPIVDDNGCLYLFYELFFDGRYHMMARALDAPDGEFSLPIEIGFGKGNDQAVSGCIIDGYPAVVWENSFPLYKGYIYPPFPDITIPAFGHGWRINTTMGMRRIRYVNGEWTFESLAESGSDAPRIHPDDSEVSGAPSLTLDENGRPVLSYVTFTHERGLSVEVKVLDGDKWDYAGTLDTSVPQRVTPGSVCMGDGTVLVSNIYRAGANMGVTAQSIELPPPSGDAQVFAPGFNPSAPEADEINPAKSRMEIGYDDKNLKAWWGDLHMHSNVSHCSLHLGFHSTELEEKYRFCRDVGDLDFAMVTDHDSMPYFDWARTMREATFHNRPGDFISFTGYEWTSSMMTDHANYGHRNVLFLDDRGPLLRIREPESDTPEGLWSKLDPERSMTIPHHPSCGEHLFDWDHYSPEFDRLAEIFQVRGADEYNDCPLYPPTYGRSAVKDHSLGEALKRGYRIGFTSGGEHEGVGVTAVYAEELTRESIFAALKARRTYGTTGARIMLDFRVNGQIMGGEIPVSEKPSIRIKVTGTCGIESIRLMRDGESIHEWQNLGRDAEIDWVDESLTGDALQSSHYYYIAVAQTDGEMAWASPVFMVL